MSRTTLLQERRMQTFQNVLGHWQARRLSALEAAEMLAAAPLDGLGMSDTSPVWLSVGRDRDSARMQT